MTLAILDIFTRAVAVGVTASITVGPVAILCIQRTLSKGRRSGIVSGLGVASADTFLAFISYIFYSILEHQINEYSSILHIVGGAAVVAVGAYIFMQNPAMQMRRNRSGVDSPWKDFASIFGVTLANFIMVVPYLLAFFAAYKIPSFDSSTTSGLLTAVAVIVGFLVGSSGWWTILATIIDRLRKKFRPRHLIMINRLAGSLIALLGLYTLISTLFHIIPNELFRQ